MTVMLATIASFIQFSLATSIIASETHTGRDSRHIRSEALQLEATDPDPSSCPLPQDARWCTFKAPGGSIQMACYGQGSEKKDNVCGELCETGKWEGGYMGKLAPLLTKMQGSTALDIGANVGVYALVAAQAGMKVEAFEPMEANLALIHATLCANPNLAARIAVHNVALGVSPMQCKLLSADGNEGDGHMCCPGQTDCHPESRQVRGTVNVVTMDSMLEKIAPATISYVKFDVEGSECLAMQGGKSLISKFHPHLIQTEVFKEMRGGCTSDEYLAMYTSQGYTAHHGFFSLDPSPDARKTTGHDDFFLAYPDEATTQLLGAPRP